ncbi:MAG TPA: helix-turn-helix transcriptional regulator [Streptosporangiaceae bacterium]
MTVRSNPSIRHRRLAGDLQRLRQAAGLDRDEVAGRLEWHSTKLYRIETARSGITVADLKHLLDQYGVKDERERQALISLARTARQKSWWTRYNDVFHSSYIGLEAEASKLRAFELIYVPGLLQTEAYARALIQGGLVVSDIERRVAARMERQQLLERDDPAELWAIIDEAALTRPVGGPAVMREQLDKLIQAPERGNITIQVIRTAVGAHPGMDGVFTMMDFPHPEFFGPVVHLETATDGLYLEEPEEVGRYTLIFDHLRAIALSPGESALCLQGIKEQFR